MQSPDDDRRDRELASHSAAAVFWFSRLRPGVSPEQYEVFLREVDYPATRRIGSIVSYQSIRVQGSALGDEPLTYHFIDLADIREIESYRADLESHPAVQEVHGQFGHYVESIANFWATPVGAGASRPGR